MTAPARDIARVGLAVEQDLPHLVKLLGVRFEQEAEFDAHEAAQYGALRAMMATPDRARVLVAERSGHPLGMTTLQVVLSTA